MPDLKDDSIDILSGMVRRLRAELAKALAHEERQRAALVEAREQLTAGQIMHALAAIKRGLGEETPC